MNANDEILLKEFLNQGFAIITENAKLDSNKLKVTPAALCIPQEGNINQLIVLPWTDDESKIEMLKALGEKCFAEKLTKVILLTDAAMKQYDHMPDIETEFPLSYPPDMRIECLMATIIDFTDQKGDDLRIFPYEIKDGKLIRKEEFPSKTDVIRSDSLLVYNIILGFVKSALVEESYLQEVHGELTEEIATKLFKCILTKYPGIKHPNGTFINL